MVWVVSSRYFLLQERMSTFNLRARYALEARGEGIQKGTNSDGVYLRCHAVESSYSNGVIIGARGNAEIVRAKAGRGYNSRVGMQSAQSGARLRIPYLDGGITGARNDAAKKNV
jgi:hypothetical protein